MLFTNGTTKLLKSNLCSSFDSGLFLIVLELFFDSNDFSDIKILVLIIFNIT